MKRLLSTLIRVTAIGFIGFYAVPICALQGPSKETPALIIADKLTYEKELGLTIARGDVEITQAGRTLYADTVTYNENADVVTASGNVRLEEPDGAIIYGDYLELEDQLKNGVIQQIRMLMVDDGRLAAHSANRLAGEKTVMSAAVYSPCKVCRAKPEEPPLWQLKSQKVIWDEKSQDIIYKNAYLEMKGVPVLWTPYMRHPDPSVKRRSGFLAPSFGGASNMGALLVTPYFYEISPSQDFTVTPMFNTKNLLMLGGEYRQRFYSGGFKIAGSGARDSRVSGTTAQPKGEPLQSRWHVIADARHDINEAWRTKLSIAKASDQTYLRRYPIFGLSTKKALTTSARLEGFHERTYTNFQAYHFQGLRSGDDPKTTPYALPMVDYNYMSAPGDWGDRWSLDANLLALGRQQGAQSRRLVLNGGWQLPYTTSYGDVYTLGTNLRGDVYNVDHVAKDKTSYNGSIGRIFPQAYADWRFPFARLQNTQQFIIEPRVGIVAAPVVGDNFRIPNEDSRLIELEDNNLLSNSRFPGLDRIEGGSRVNYGMHFGAQGKEMGNTDIFLGQSYQFQKPNSYLQSSGLENQSSDYVGRIYTAPRPELALQYRFRLDRARLQARRHEVSVSMGPPLLKLQSDYVFLNRILSHQDPKSREQISATLSSQFTQYWKASVSTTRDLAGGGGNLSQGVGLTYQDECFATTTSIAKTFYTDRDIKPGTTFLVRVVFKNLGQML